MTISQVNSTLGTGGIPPPPRIIRVGPERREEALQWLLAVDGQPQRAGARRFMEYAAGSQVHLEAMWSLVNDEGAIRATVLAVPSAGRTAMVFATAPAEPSAAAAVGRLIEHATASLVGLDVHLAQALLEPGQALHQQAFMTGGFIELAPLSYLERPLHRGQPGAKAQWPSGVAVEPYVPALESEFLSALEASYEQTLDCPGLLGLRATRDVLGGHRATGRFEPALWTLMRVEGAPSGVLLLNPSPASQSIELVYLGISIGARGRGLGRQLLRHGLHLLRDRQERSITLAVDERNSPALSLYLGEGFRRSLRRVAMIRPLRGAAG